MTGPASSIRSGPPPGPAPGLGSTKLYLLLVAWLDGRAPPRVRSDFGEALLAFLRDHARALPPVAAVGKVEADLSTVRQEECRAVFAAAATALVEGRRLRAVFDAGSLVRLRERSRQRATRYTAALLAEREGHVDGGVAAPGRGAGSLVGGKRARPTD